LEFQSKMSKPLLVQVAFVLLAISGAILCESKDLPAAINVLTALVTIAGVVVTVFGIWIALIFPRLLSGYESGVGPSGLPEVARYNALVAALYRSCFALCASGFVFIIVGLYGVPDVLFLRSIAWFTWLVFFSICESMWSAVVSGEVALTVGINKSKKTGLIRRLRRLGQFENGDAPSGAEGNKATPSKLRK
jgi:hypothetical protein